MKQYVTLATQVKTPSAAWWQGCLKIEQRDIVTQNARALIDFWPVLGKGGDFFGEWQSMLGVCVVLGKGDSLIWRQI